MFKWLGFLFRFGPLLVRWGGLVMQTVRTVEKLFSSAPSHEKKAAAMALVTAALERAGIINPHLIEAFSHLIDLIVAVLHARGEFAPVTAPRASVDVPTAAASVAQEVAPQLVKDAQRVARRIDEQVIRDSRLDELEQQLRRD
jgi:hypothetical protein